MNNKNLNETILRFAYMVKNGGGGMLTFFLAIKLKDSVHKGILLKNLCVSSITRV